MNDAYCSRAMEYVGSGVGASLRAVDCAAGEMARAAFGRLFGADGALMLTLTILLTLYIAFFAFSLITGRSRIGISALTPRILTLGLVLTFATSWIAYQSVVWNLATGAPDQIAGVLMGTQGSATNVFADKIDVVFAALIEASGPQAMQQGAASTFSPPGLLWMGGTLLLLGTVGVLAVCKICLAVLLALGPVFIVMALFNGTRGLFVGWLKGMVMVALAPLFAVLGGSLMLELSVPVIGAIGQVPGTIDPRAAMAFFMIGAVHAALMVMVIKLAGTMVAGWSVFGLARPHSADEGNKSAAPAPAAAPQPAAQRANPSAQASVAASREIRVTASTPAAANDSGPAGGSIRRETTVLPAAGGAAASQSSRTRGVGSRFRSPSSSRPTGSLARASETLT